MPKTTPDVSTPLSAAASSSAATAAAPARSAGRNRRSEPNPLGGNFILMPSLLEYLSPDLTLPEQYFYRQRNDDGMGAEKALMYAVLKDGIRCFYKHVGATRRKYRKMSAEAEEWLMEDTYDYPFSFRVICDTLGIDADCLRRRLLAWKEFELERRESTGDTKSVQVGRSPFPTYVEDGDDSQPSSEPLGQPLGQLTAQAMAASGITLERVTPADHRNPSTANATATDTATATAAAPATDDLLDDAGDDAWGEIEHVSLDELALEEVA